MTHLYHFTESPIANSGPGNHLQDWFPIEWGWTFDVVDGVEQMFFTIQFENCSWRNGVKHRERTLIYRFLIRQGR